MIAGALGCLTPAAGPTRISRLLLAALAVLGAAIVLQIVPLPLAVLRALSPNAPAMLERTDFAYGAGLTRFHSLSVAAPSTLVPLVLFASLAVLVIGTSRSMAGRHPRGLVEALTVFAVAFALIGIVQKPLYAGKVLGFWEPEGTGSPFATFVNKNHFAGWMVMALPLSLGLLAAGLEKAMRLVRPGWRYKVLWLSSPEASRLILLGAGVLIMALSLVLTMSRSGISALALSVVLMGVVVARGSRRQIPAGGGRHLSRGPAGCHRDVGWHRRAGRPVRQYQLERVQRSPRRLDRCDGGDSRVSRRRHRLEHLPGRRSALPAARSVELLRPGPQRLSAARSPKEACWWRSRRCSASPRSGGRSAGG